MANPQPLDVPLVYNCREQTTPKYTATILDDDGVAIPASALVSLTLTLYVSKTDGTTGIVNSRNAQNVLNLNDVTVDSNGLLTYSLQVADTTLVEALPFERHIALWEWTWASGSKAGKHEVVFNIQNLTEV